MIKLERYILLILYLIVYYFILLYFIFVFFCIFLPVLVLSHPSPGFDVRHGAHIGVVVEVAARGGGCVEVLVWPVGRVVTAVVVHCYCCL